MADPNKRRALGRGLDALLPASPAGGAPGADHFLARIEDLHPSRQPRTRFDDASLNTLAESLKDKGLLAPLLVRRRARGGYEIIAGERRWRAAQRAGVFEVPVIIREMQDGEAFEAALVENLQREDLNPLEVARAFQRLIDEHEHSQDSIAALTGKDRSTVYNALRLLNLPESILDLIESGQLSEGHGRALLTVTDRSLMEKLARKAVERGWSVRETERQARGAAHDQERQREGSRASPEPRPGHAGHHRRPQGQGPPHHPLLQLRRAGQVTGYILEIIKSIVTRYIL
jgi:ParB family chromosome partitioning protein